MAKKRAKGEGTVRQLKSGGWVSIIMVGRTEEGKKKYHRIHGDTRAELTINIAAFHQQQQQGVPVGDVPFCDHATKWFERHKKNIRPSTQDGYKHTLKALVNYWDDTPIRVIKPSHLYDMMLHFETKEHRSVSFLTKIRGMAYQIFDAAVADDLITKNPAAYMNYKIGENNKEKSIFTAEELCQIAAQPTNKMRDGTLFLTGSGIRLGEYLGLRGIDCHPEGKFVAIVQAANMEGGVPVIGPTKNTASIRKIPIPAPLQHIVAAYANYGVNLIWESPKKPGRPMNPSSFRDSFKRFCKQAGVQELTPHCCRHTYASLLNHEDANELAVKRLMGHTTKDMTAHYTHLLWDKLEESAHLLDKYFAEIST